MSHTSSNSRAVWKPPGAHSTSSSETPPHLHQVSPTPTRPPSSSSPVHHCSNTLPPVGCHKPWTSFSSCHQAAWSSVSHCLFVGSTHDLQLSAGFLDAPTWSTTLLNVLSSPPSQRCPPPPFLKSSWRQQCWAISQSVPVCSQKVLLLLRWRLRLNHQLPINPEYDCDRMLF